MKKLAFSLLAMLFCVSAAIAQTTTIKGKVVDRNNQPVEGASVKEKGTGNGTSTDKDGNFILKVSSSDATLVFSGVGLTEQEKSVKGTNYVETAMISSSVSMGEVAVVGTRSIRRSATETAVPIDVIPVSKILNTLGQVDMNQILQYVAPSFNSNKQSGADGADHIDPATLRGLGPDQTLVLVNGKRWHQSSLVNLYGTRGRGNTGTDLNSIPAASIERIEILRDGAAAQYGSDAIAGVINIVLKTSPGSGSANVSYGTNVTGYGSSLKSPKGKVLSNTTDGGTINANVNYGFKLKDNGFINLTADYLHKNKTLRPNFETLYPDNYRKKFGEAGNDNYSLYFNGSIPLKNNAEFYAFGGINQRNGDAYAFTRDAGSERNVVSIYPNGFDPRIQSDISDKAFAFGIKTKLCGWASDFFANLGGNRFQYHVANTLNASLLGASPTRFDAGGFQLNQNSVGANFSKGFSKVAKGANVAFGAEVREEQYRIFAGELGSYKQYLDNQGNPIVFSINGTDTVFRPGGSQGFPGFQPKDETFRQRVSEAAFIDGELDVSKNILVSGAVRAEHFSDFGWTANYKLAARIKYDDRLAFRASVSSGFRAPSLPQKHFSNTFTNVAAGQIYEIVLTPNDGPIASAVGIPALKEETSVNWSWGFTSKPAKNLVITVDGYNIKIRNKVVLTGLFYNDDDVIGSTLTNLNVGAAQFFTNAVQTNTSGLDIIATYGMKLGAGKMNFTFAGNFNKMKINKITTIPELVGKEDTYYGKREQYFLLASAPPHKISFAADYRIGNFGINARATNFAGVEIINFADEIDGFNAKTTVDLSFNFNINNKASITVGGANILDVYPTKHDPGLSESGGMWDAVQMGFGGAYYFAKVGIKF